jgi:sugar phosphate isomerase/epimerase
VNTILLSPTTLPQASAIEYAKAAAAAGFKHVGMRFSRSPGLPFDPVAGNVPLIAELKRILAGEGMTVYDIYSFYLTPQTTIEEFVPAVELSAEFGAKFLVVMGADPEWSRMRDNFAALCDLAAGHGLSTTIEAAVIRPLATFAQARRIIEESGCGNGTVCIDPLNFIRGGETPDDLRAADPKLFPYAQICDGVLGPGEPNPALNGRMSPNQRRMIGEGTMPLAEIYDALPPGIPLSIEAPRPPDATLDHAQWAAIAHDAARRFLEKYYAGRRGD